jgi:chorismate synthase
MLEKFGGDSIGETRRNLEGYLAAIPQSHRTGSASDSSAATGSAAPTAP